MLNDVIFNNEKSAYYDWSIVLTKASIPLPSIKTSSVDIKGANGILDLSEVLTGDVCYSNRDIKLTFSLMEDMDYNSTISNIANYLHGKKVTLKLTNDDEYFYSGRAIISQWEYSPGKGTLVISISADPFKYSVTESNVLINLSNETKSLTLPNKRMRVSPTLVVTGSVTMTFEGKTYTLQAGKQQLLNFVLSEGNNNVSFSGTGSVKITYRQGAL